MSEKQKMLAGQPCDPADRDLTNERLHVRKSLHVLNNGESDKAGYSLSSRATVR
ncbi:MAG TPA: hypothetical protein DDX19_05710 [Rhodopirellula baltica]|nr:hypothetical protein [Rhodopirellula baltica]